MAGKGDLLSVSLFMLVRRSLRSSIRKSSQALLRLRSIHQTPRNVRSLSTRPLQGRQCLITGGTSEIGIAISKIFFEAGASSIALVGRNKERLSDRIEKLKSTIPGFEDSHVIPIIADVSKEIPDIAKVYSNLLMPYRQVSCDLELTC